MKRLEKERTTTKEELKKGLKRIEKDWIRLKRIEKNRKGLKRNEKRQRSERQRGSLGSQEPEDRRGAGGVLALRPARSLEEARRWGQGCRDNLSEAGWGAGWEVERLRG